MNNIIILILFFLVTGCSASKQANSDATKEMRYKTAKINSQLGIAYLEQHNIERAKQKLLMAIDQAPTIPEPWYSMGYFYEATGNDAMARQYYMKAVQIAPNRGDVQNNFGTYLCRNKEYASSIKHFLLATNDPDYLNAGDAYENAGLCAAKIPNKALAMQYFKRALLLNPDRTVSIRELNKLEQRTVYASKKHMKTMSDYL